jgi:UDP-N-acetylmuramoyl-tripeptide--D-alanyl-D-alanine ligase
VIPLAIDEARSICPGELRVAAGASTIMGVEIDSRRAGRGDLFVAIRGGVAFVDDALARGASALVPDDPFAAMAALGRWARDRSRARVVGVTGSAGKTSTKDILAALCRPVARTVAAESGHNNEIGLPLTLTRIEADTEVVVTEMGMRGLGQIAALCELARPHVGVITSVAPVHLEFVGTVENVARAKAEVVESLSSDGVAIVPSAAPELDPFLRADVELRRFGRGGDVTLERFDPPLLVADVRGTLVELDVPFTQRVQAHNTLAALAAYDALGLPLDRAHEGAREIAFSRWRGEEYDLPGGGLVINDAYNANPASMHAALEHLVERAAGRRTVAVLGEMAELGPESPRYHDEVGRAARRLGIDVVVAIGGSLAHEYGADVEARDVGDAVERLRELLAPGDAVLVKASRAAGLEAVADALVGVGAPV